MGIGLEKKFVLDTVERNGAAIAHLCDNIFYFAELGMQEFESSGLMMELLEKAGFSIDEIFRHADRFRRNLRFG